MLIDSEHVLGECSLQRLRLPQWLTVSTNLDPRLGGVSAIMPSLVDAVEREGEFTLTLAAFASPEENLTGIQSAFRSGPHAYQRFDLSGLGSLLDGKKERALDTQIERASGVHIHGIWQEHCVLAARRARARNKPYVISAHGMLEPWALAQKRWKKIAYSALFEARNLRGAACLHALTTAEAGAYHRIAPGVPVAVIPNGVDVPEEVSPETFLARFPDLRGRPIVLFLGRLHPKKGLDLLVDSWSTIAQEWPDARLVIAGPDTNGYRAQLEHRISNLRLLGSVVFAGMLNGSLKWSALAAADLFVLPSYSEGLSVSVLEALGMGRPVIVTEQCHVEGIASNNCGWEIQPRACELTEALHAFFALSRTGAHCLGRNGKALVRDLYNWSSVGQQITALYRWLGGGVKPAELRLM